MKKGRNNPLGAVENFYCCLVAWGITSRQLNDAILETGSLEVLVVRDYLVRTKILISFCGIFYYSRQKVMRYIRGGRKNAAITSVKGKVFVVVPGIPHMAICSN